MKMILSTKNILIAVMVIGFFILFYMDIRSKELHLTQYSQELLKLNPVLNKELLQLQPVPCKKFIESLPFKKNYFDLNNTIYKYFPINLLLNGSKKCNKTEVYDIVFLVKGFIKNLDKRNAIRETWGNENRKDNFRFKTVFFMGIDYKNPNVLKEILKENEIYKDIVVGEYQDEYRNNSIKCLMSLLWAKNYCFNSRFYIIADDDGYFNNVNLMNYLNEISFFTTHNNSVPTFRYAGGALVQYNAPQRSGKFAISEKEYPWLMYPNFLNGHAIVLSKDVLIEFISIARYTWHIWLDDVYFGLLADTADIKLVNIPNSSGYHPGNNVDLFDEITTSHYIPTANLLRIIWNEQNRRGHA